MYRSILFASISLFAAVNGQGAGDNTKEVHPKLTAQKCTGNEQCSPLGGTVVLDANWRWVHNKEGYENCYDGSEWVDEYCPDSATCTKNCVLEGVDYKTTYGISTSGDALTLSFVTEHEYGTNIGGRVYMMDSSDKGYQLFKLKNQEFTFDVDVSNLPCGLNGALYFSEMAADGGPAEAGAAYGTGYCDAQCPHDIKFIEGEANVEGWTPSETDPNAGSGKWGTCCNEMDIWEANSISTAYTPHGCTKSGPYRCEGTECGDGDERYSGVCDKDGCDFNSYRFGEKEFYGPGMTIDTKKKFTVVTQFITDDNTANGKLVEIRRIYVQGGKVIQNTASKIDGVEGDSITDEFCDQAKTAFGDNNDYKKKGGLAPMDKALTNGMVLVMSVWDDHAAHMLWLDSSYPLDKDPSEPGVARGTCPTDSGVPAEIEASAPKSTVTFSKIRTGDLNSTYPNKLARKVRRS